MPADKANPGNAGHLVHVTGTAAMPLRSGVFDASSVRLGGFRLDAGLVGRMTGFQALVPPDSVTGAGINPSFQRSGDGLYHGASAQAPEIGDLQVSFEDIEVQPISVIAAGMGG